MDIPRAAAYFIELSQRDFERLWGLVTARLTLLSFFTAAEGYSIRKPTIPQICQFLCGYTMHKVINCRGGAPAPTAWDGVCIIDNTGRPIRLTVMR